MVPPVGVRPTPLHQVDPELNLQVSEEILEYLASRKSSGLYFAPSRGPLALLRKWTSELEGKLSMKIYSQGKDSEGFSLSGFGNLTEKRLKKCSSGPLWL